jgi:aspartyl-tRNA(Asn)/glutamyl-tRNA(Gln) amidotransferase subunit B
MEEGSMRVDANVSVRRVGETEHGAKVEVKNMNSIRSVGRALEFEEKRQRAALDNGETLVQETRHFDEKLGTTTSGRLKEGSSDYRYFREPDLVPFEPDPGWIESIRQTLPETPAQRRERFASHYGLGAYDIGVLTASLATARWFEAAAEAYPGEAKKVVNWITADLFGLLNEAGQELSDSKVAPQKLAALVQMIDDGTISGKQAKIVLEQMFATGDDPATIADAQGLSQVSDANLIAQSVDEVIAENPAAADKVRGGQLNTIGFLVGQVMKKTRGQANPQMVNDLLRQKLS